MGKNLKNKLHFLKALGTVIFYRYPARKIKVIGVTGTDGKTTTSSLIYHLLKTAGKKVALISTVGAYVGNKEIDTGLHVTSPNPRFLQKFIRKIVDKGYKYLVLEATSHGLDQHRLLGTNVSIAVLTNVTHEHLDYHQSLSKYIKAKAKLFRGSELAILNKKDASFKKIKKLLNKKTRVIGYDDETTKGKVEKAVKKRFPEQYNRFNASAAILVAKELGVDESTIVKAVKSFSSVPGRMEEVKNKKGIKIIVDFAHTPNALEKVLNYLKKTKKKGSKLIAVFGCAGERDFMKRSMMGKISSEIADISVFTAEDPRHEDVKDIIAQMMEGVNKVHKRKGSKVYVEPERGKAIALAIQDLAKRGDIIVISGKGHEKSMAFDGREYPWSDIKVAKAALEGKVVTVKQS
ncbi:MAG: UDP-N-acetylmuramoyl-L-alanyl-D-glutamate--2,6-diaminopimelate ligase [Patescibacteria group bacterium]